MLALRRSQRFLVVILTLCATACGGPVRISMHPDPPPNLVGYRTYGWMSRSVPSPAVEPSIAGLDARIRAAVDAQLSLKGYLQRPLSAPDFLVGYRTATQYKTTETVEEFYAYKQAGGNEAPQVAFGRGFEEGSLTLELIDARTRQLLWRASAVAVISERPAGDRVPEAVRLMLENLPAATR